MSTCPNCRGTGVAPIKLRQECIGCQRKVTVTFETYDDLILGDGIVYCDECKPVSIARTALTEDKGE